MTIIPAIDILNGQAVRLYQGNYQQKTVVNRDPLAQALIWQKLGATLIHLVDLDGAKNGRPTNFTLIKKIIATLNIPIQVGGGIRTKKDIEAYLAAGAQNVILGSAAIKNPQLLRLVSQKYGQIIVVAIDAHNNLVMTGGWLESSQLKIFDLVKKVTELGIKKIIFTDITRDGTLTQPNYQLLTKLIKQTNLSIVASGGIASLAQIKRLTRLGIKEAIVGQALYSGRIDFRQAQQSF
ncbi:MAG: 1-(5-phosphoribosyl)-5-[(5-phosphoribosylamino)methylideneamino]imidazole-4-carboxamide isomerase [Candidatus Buchananbacteria bacterium]